MAARSLGSLTISFGLLSIPVNLFSATESSDSISFNLLHKDCGSRLKQQYVCATEGVVVERADMVKGYEFEKGRFVTFTPEEIKAFEEIGTHSIDITEFIVMDAIDPVYFDRMYYLTPEKRATKAYSLFAQALGKSERGALGTWAARGNSNLVVIRPIGNVLAMQQLRFGYEVRPATEFDVPPHEVKDSELKLAIQLIEQQSTDAFDPGAYTDVKRSRIEAAIQQKVKGEKFSVAEPVEDHGDENVIDIMEALRASLQKTKSTKTRVTQLGARKGPKRATQPAKAARKSSR